MAKSYSGFKVLCNLICYLLILSHPLIHSASNTWASFLFEYSNFLLPQSSVFVVPLTWNSLSPEVLMLVPSPHPDLCSEIPFSLRPFLSTTFKIIALIFIALFSLSSYHNIYHPLTEHRFYVFVYCLFSLSVYISFIRAGLSVLLIALSAELCLALGLPSMNIWWVTEWMDG